MPLGKLVDGYREDIIGEVIKLIRIPSIMGEPMPGYPFGEGPTKALEYVLELGKRLGFRVKNLDGYAGYAEIGQGDEVIAILGHLDVVPAGDSWTYPPFGGEVHNGRIYGRGSIDNKGPTVGAMYAMKAVLEAGVPLDKRVRIIFGTDEETAWRGIEYYLEREPMPDFGLVPDANYPVIHAEKGILTISLGSKFDGGSLPFGIDYIEGGDRDNMVPDRCICTIKKERDIDKILTHLNSFKKYSGCDLRADINSDGNTLIITSIGKSAHGSTPELGINAIGQMLAFLCTLGLGNSSMEEFILFLNNKIGLDHTGKLMGIDGSDNVSGDLTLNLGTIKIDKNGAKANINIRYPVTFELDSIMEDIQKAVERKNIDVNIVGHNPPLYVKEDDPLILQLLEIYEEFTGEKAKPITTGGGTYARALDYAVAFGAQFPQTPDLAHQGDEYIDIEELILHTRIYAEAIARLAGENDI
ncbi:MAG: dipeptidase PepV [Clostridiales bacterium]|nr:dipeptidase PepV [Clostridiales bacterium]